MSKVTFWGEIIWEEEGVEIEVQQATESRFESLKLKCARTLRKLWNLCKTKSREPRRFKGRGRGSGSGAVGASNEINFHEPRKERGIANL
jgi:hypothetical protein